MKNYLNVFAPVEEKNREKYTYKDSWIGLGFFAGLSIAVVGGIVFFAMALPINEGDPWTWPSIIPYFYGVIGALLLAISAGVATNAQAELTYAQRVAFENFMALSLESRSELGGERNFYNSLMTMNDKESKRVFWRITEILSEENRAAEVERKMRSAAPELLQRLDGIKSERRDFRSSMEELL